MRIFFGLFFATLTNFVAGILGFYIATNFFYSSLNLDYLNNEISSSDYVSSFALKFFVILILTWIMHRVMAMLDTPKKRILFIFLLGSSFSLYNQVDVFWVEYSFTWSLISVLGESINWLLTGYVLSRFIKPKHLGAL
jgi:hypothetical protein